MRDWYSDRLGVAASVATLVSLGYMLASSVFHAVASVTWGLVLAALIMLLGLGTLTRFLLGRHLARYSFPLRVRTSDQFPYVFEQYRVDRKLEFDEVNLMLSIRSVAEVEVTSLRDGIHHVSHSLGTGVNLAVALQDFALELLEHERRYMGKLQPGTVSLIRTRRGSGVSEGWRAVFEPPLQKGETASYTFRWFYRKAKLLTGDDFAQAKSRELLPRDRDFEILLRTATVPVKGFRSSVEFPLSYPVHDADFEVRRVGHLMEHEMRHLGRKSCFTQIPPSGERGWRLELTMSALIPSASYVIRWKPPSLNELAHSGFLKGDQLQQVRTRLSGAILIPGRTEGD